MSFLIFQDEPEFLEDSLALPGFSTFSSKFVSSEDELVDSDDVSNSLPQSRPSMLHTPFTDSKSVIGSAGIMKRDPRRRVPYGWLHKLVITIYSPSFSCLFFFLTINYLSYQQVMDNYDW